VSNSARFYRLRGIATTSSTSTTPQRLALPQQHRGTVAAPHPPSTSPGMAVARVSAYLTETTSPMFQPSPPESRGWNMGWTAARILHDQPKPTAHHRIQADTTGLGRRGGAVLRFRRSDRPLGLSERRVWDSNPRLRSPAIPVFKTSALGHYANPPGGCRRGLRIPGGNGVRGWGGAGMVGAAAEAPLRVWTEVGAMSGSFEGIAHAVRSAR
jgi:hypothetical protein